MIPDGVATAALEPMETLEASVAPGAQPPAGEGEGSNQAASQMEEVIGEPTGESGQGQPEASKEAPPPAKIGNSKTLADPKAKSCAKTPTKTKPGAAGPTKTTTGPASRPNTAQSRLTNGVNKTQTNGVAKKTATNPGAGDKKSTPTSAASKRPAGAAASPASKTPTKPADRKPLGATRPSTAPASNGLKPATGTAAAAKKTSTTAPANGAKTAAAAAKKPPAPRPASAAAPTKPGSTAAPKTDRPPVSKTTRPSTGTASSRPASAPTRPATAGTTKSTTPSSKPLTPKATPKAAGSTTPSAGKTPTSLASKTTTPIKKDVTKPATPVAKKPAASPLTRPSSAKTPKPDTPKSASKPDSSATKKPAASKPTETKTKAKPQETKPAPTRTPAAKPATAKPSSPKKAVGSSTPMPVKRGPKPATAAESEAKEDDSSTTVAAAAAAAAATAAAVAVAAATVTLAATEEEELVSTTQAQPEPEPAAAAAVPQLSAQLDLVCLSGPADDLTSPLGTTVMSPPCSPPGPMSPVREPQCASLLLDPHTQHEPWSQEMRFQQEEDEEEEKENLLLPSSTAPAGSFSTMGHPDLLGTSPSLTSPSQDKEVAVEKADEEINDDDDEDDEEEEERKAGRQTSSVFADLSGSQPSEESHVRSSGPAGSAGWHGEDLLSAMDSEEVSSSTSSRQQGVSEMSSTQHTGLLEGTQSSDALVDSSLRGSEGDGNFMGSPNVETLANDEEDEEEEEGEERVDEMDVSSERADDHHVGSQQREQQRHPHHHHEEKEEEEEEEEDEDVEMPSEGVTESCLESYGYVDDDEDFNEEERVDNLNRSAGALPPVPPASAWGQSKPLNPFADPWAQPSLLPTTTTTAHTSSPSPLSDHGAADPETPTLSPAQAWLDMSGHSLVPEAALEPHHREKSGAEASAQLAAPAAGMSQSSTLSGTALAAHSSSETSTPEELQDYDSSSGVESRSDKQQTPVPAAVQPDMDQDLGIHLERGDGEEEEAETLPADEVLGTGPPTAPASAPSSPSTSGDEASDTEGEMQINDPDAPLTAEDRAAFDSPPPARNLPALDEDEEAAVADAPAGEGDEDGGGTPQSANSVASYGFDCTTSNSNAHSTAESCGRSPGIFSLENEDQLPEEAKDPSFIKELTLPAAAAAAAHADELLGGPVDLLPLGHPGEHRASLDDDDHHHHYMLGGKVGGDGLEEVDPLEPSLRLGGQHAGDSSDGYYSAICDKTDSFLAGEEDNCADPDDDDYEEDVESDQEEQSESVPALAEQHAHQQNQNLSSSVIIANGHYLTEVPGNRRPIDPVLAASFSLIVPPPPANNNNTPTDTTNPEGGGSAGGQLGRLEQHQAHLREVQHRQEQERQKRLWLEEERQRLEQQKQLERQRRELLQLQLQQEHRHRRQVLQWQLELEQQHRLQQKQMQQQQQARRSPTGVMLSPSTGLCTIYEAMETSEEEEEEEDDEGVGGEQNENRAGLREKGRCSPNQTMKTDSIRRMRPVPPQDLDWCQKVDMVQQLINQTLLLSGDGGCPPLLLLPVGTGGTLSPLESSMWPSLLPPFSPSLATVTSVSSYSPDSQGSSFPGDWTVVEVETQH